MKPSFLFRLSLQACFLLMATVGFSQGTTCNSAEPFCTGTGDVFPNTTGAGDAQSGPDYGCLFSTPNPSWFFMQVGMAGNITLTIDQTSSGGGGLDVDFICWGPFESLDGVCSQLTSGNIEDCSYSIQAVETCNITNAQFGDFYVVLITNYSNSSGSIDFQQTGGVGEADCDVLNPCTADAGEDQSICMGASIQIGGAPSASGGDDSFVYSWAPVTGLDDPSSPNPTASPSTTTTYTLNIDDEAGCTQSDEVTVSILLGPTATMPSIYDICSGEIASVTITLSGVAPYEFEYTINGVDQGITESATDTYTFDVATDALIEISSIADQDCAGTAGAIAEVIVHELPSAVIGGDGTYCSGSPFDLPIDLMGAAPFEIAYTIDGVLQPLINTSSSNYLLSGTASGTYEIVSITDTYCTDGLQNSSVVGFYPAIDISLEFENEICESEPVTVTATATGGQGGPYDFLWTDANANTFTGNPVEVISSSDISLDLIVTDGCNIPYTATASIDVLAPPIVDCGPSATVDCLDSTPILDGSASDGGEFLWTTSDGNILSDPALEIITIDSPGTYQLEVTSSIGCVGSNSISVASTMFVSTATLTGPEILCEGEVGDFSLVFDQSAVWNIMYMIDGVLQPNSYIVGTQLDFSSDQPGLYEIISANTGACDAVILNELEVTVEEIPTAIFPSGDVYICEGESGLVEVLVSGTGSLTIEYELDGILQDSIITNAGSYEIIGDEGTFIPISISSDLCVGEVTGGFQLVDAPLPTASLTTEEYTICEGESASVVVDLSGTAPFEFTYTLNGIIQDPLLSSVGPFLIPIESSGSVQLISINDSYCEGTVSGQSEVMVNPLPSASITGGTTVCTGVAVDLPISIEGSGPFEIDYTIDGTVQTPIETSEQNFDITTSQPGTYILTSISDALCSDGVQNTTTISNFPPIAVALDYTSLVCINDSVIISAMASGGMSDGYSFLWNDLVGNTYTTSQLTLVLSQSMDFALSVNDGCDIPTNELLSIEVQAYPEPSFFSMEDSVCIGEIADFINTSDDESTQCLWTFDDGAVLSGCDGVSHSFSSPGYESVTLSASTSAGCTGVFNLDSVLFVAPDPLAEFRIHPVDGTIFKPEIQFENVSEHAVEYLWEFGDGLTTEDHSPLHSYPGSVADSYIACLTAYNILGCIDTVCHYLEIEPEFLMSAPNAFTPDNDGVNDYFIPIFNDIVLAEYELIIFNRLGEIVFESTDQFESWNGAGESGSNYYGMDAVYFYRVRTREENRSEKREHIGEVILIR